MMSFTTRRGGGPVIQLENFLHRWMLIELGKLLEGISEFQPKRV
jgi:hypothetical protein